MVGTCACTVATPKPRAWKTEPLSLGHKDDNHDESFIVWNNKIQEGSEFWDDCQFLEIHSDIFVNLPSYSMTWL